MRLFKHFVKYDILLTTSVCHVWPLKHKVHLRPGVHRRHWSNLCWKFTFKNIDFGEELIIILEYNNNIWTISVLKNNYRCDCCFILSRLTCSFSFILKLNIQVTRLKSWLLWGWNEERHEVCVPLPPSLPCAPRRMNTGFSLIPSHWGKLLCISMSLCIDSLIVTSYWFSEERLNWPQSEEQKPMNENKQERER